VSALDEAPLVEVHDREALTELVAGGVLTATGAWMVTWRPATGRPTLDYEAAVEEALCFGWVDSKSKAVDELRTSIYFTPRKAKSAWSESNVARVEKLEAAGLMRAAGRRAVEEAKANGRWPA